MNTPRKKDGLLAAVLAGVPTDNSCNNPCSSTQYHENRIRAALDSFHFPAKGFGQKVLIVPLPVANTLCCYSLCSERRLESFSIFQLCPFKISPKSSAASTVQPACVSWESCPQPAILAPFFYMQPRLAQQHFSAKMHCLVMDSVLGG